MIIVASRRRKPRSSPLSRKRILLFSIIIILLVYGVSMLLISIFSMSSPYRIEVMDYDFTVKDGIGINLDSDYLHFGGGPSGAFLERSISITSDMPAKVSISWEGPGDLSVDKNDFKIGANETTPVTFYLGIPENLSLGNYSGTVFLRFFKP